MIFAICLFFVFLFAALTCGAWEKNSKKEGRQVGLPWVIFSIVSLAGMAFSILIFLYVVFKYSFGS